MNSGDNHRYRRVIVDLPVSAADRRALRAAAELARGLDAELRAMFVEEEGLLSLARMPFAREFRLPGHGWQPIAGEQIAADMRQAAQAARRMLEEVARAAGISGALEVHRGEAGALIETVCVETDVVVVLEPARPAERAVQGYVRRRLAAYRCAAAMMLLPPELPEERHGVVALAEDGGVLPVAARIAARLNENLTVLTRDGPEPARIALAAQAQGMRSAQVRVRRLAGTGGVADIVAALAGGSPRLAVLSRGTLRPEGEETVSELARALRAPVLVLEPPPPTQQHPAATAH
jgi:hypothetical protein